LLLIQETESQLEIEHNAAKEARESATVSERKLIALQTELEDVRSLLESVCDMKKHLVE
jgi:hypothetical protein